MLWASHPLRLAVRDGSEPCDDGLPDLARRIFLQVMPAADGHFPLVLPGAAIVAQISKNDRTGIAVDEQLSYFDKHESCTGERRNKTAYLLPFAHASCRVFFALKVSHLAIISG
jgi:hypothetical protein